MAFICPLLSPIDHEIHQQNRNGAALLSMPDWRLPCTSHHQIREAYDKNKMGGIRVFRRGLNTHRLCRKDLNRNRRLFYTQTRDRYRPLIPIR